MSDSPLLEIKNLHKRYGKVHAVKGVNLKVFKPEVIGLVGNNGAGKSTFIKTLIGAIPKTDGEIYWKGNKVEINSITESRDLGIETVYQEQALFDQLSIVKNVFMGREIKKSVGPFKVLDFKKMKEIVKPLLNRLGLDVPHLDHEVRFCSGGERQGVAIARAMHFKAELVILDEPTTALSVSAVKKVLSFIEQLKQEGISVIVISHNINHVASIADRVVAIATGEKVLDVEMSETSIEEIEEMLAKGAMEGVGKDAV